MHAERIAPLKLRKVAAGIYETLDGQHRIVKTEGWDGPRGGTFCLWEHASPDRWSGWVLDGYGGHRTLRDARADLAVALNQKESTDA